MSEPRFPAGWDAERVKRLIAHYESLSEDEQVAEDEAAALRRPGDQGTPGRVAHKGPSQAEGRGPGSVREGERVPAATQLPGLRQGVRAGGTGGRFPAPSARLPGPPARGLGEDERGD